ncbi:MAG: hypothetical protein Kapaf2KO_15140 [Candidatus Kapaibacteriales bacterium]
MEKVEYSVLIADDDIWMQRVLAKTLQSYGFSKTYLAGDGIEAVAKCVEHRPSLIVLDILMPEMSGHLALRLLKTIKLTKDIPVLMVSALSDVENLGKAVKSGTAGFISKPFTRATVHEKLVDLYGTERLDYIMKGLPLPEGDHAYFQETGFFYKDPFVNTSEGDEEEYDDSGNDPKSKLDDEKPNIGKSKLEKSYREEDRTSIESIKEMLLNSSNR